VGNIFGFTRTRMPVCAVSTTIFIGLHVHGLCLVPPKHHIGRTDNTGRTDHTGPYMGTTTQHHPIRNSVWLNLHELLSCIYHFRLMWNGKPVWESHNYKFPSPLERSISRPSHAL